MTASCWTSSSRLPTNLPSPPKSIDSGARPAAPMISTRARDTISHLPRCVLSLIGRMLQAQLGQEAPPFQNPSERHCSAKLAASVLDHQASLAKRMPISYRTMSGPMTRAIFRGSTVGVITAASTAMAISAYLRFLLRVWASITPNFARK